VYRTGRYIDVLGGYHLADLFDRQVVGLHLARVHIYLYLPFGSTHHTHRTDAVHTVEAIDELVVQQLVKPVVALVGRHGKHHDGNHGAAELVQRGVVHIIGQERAHTVDGIADIV